MREVTLNRYIQSLVEAPRVQSFLNENNHKQKPFVCPPVIVVPSCGALTAALTYGSRLVEVSSWILESDSETKSILRHEFAHVLKHHCDLPGSAHGRVFIQSLKHVSPKTWRTDKYWYPDNAIEEARLKMHPKSKTIINRVR